MRPFPSIGTMILITLAACSGAQAPPPSPTAPSTTVAVTSSTSDPSPSTTAPPSSEPAPTSTSIADPSPLAGRTVVLDPGHNGLNWSHPDEINRLVDIGNGTKACNTTGTQINSGYTEAQFNWDVAVLTRDRLQALGASVILTRPDNDGWGPCINERAAVGNNAGADAVISIHADGGPPDGRGFHVIHPGSVPGLTDDIEVASLHLALALHTAYSATGMPTADYVGTDGFSVRTDIGGLNLSDVPAVFLETGNMRNPVDAALLTDPEFQGSIAEAITAALIEFLSRR